MTRPFAGGIRPLSGPNQQLVAITLLGLMVPIATYSRELLGEPGSVALGALLFGGIMALIARSSDRRSIPYSLLVIAATALPLVSVYAVSTLVDPGLQAVSNLSQLVLALGFMAGVSLVPWSRAALRPLFWIFGSLLVIFVAWWLASGADRIFRAAMGHPNALGLFALLLTFVPLLFLFDSPRWRFTWALAGVFVACGVLILYASTSRSTWLAAAGVIAVYLVWPIIARSRLLFHLAYLVTVTGALVVTWFYLIAPQHDWGWRLQELTVDLTGKNLFSGRQLFWGELVEAIRLQPWFGYGASARAETFTSFSWSAHSLYLQVTLQVGLVGLGLLLFLLWVIWARLWPGRHSLTVRVAAGYFLGMLVHQAFEVSLIQNNLGNGFLFWFITGVALAAARRRVT
ncbi:MAG TPA: O-antigen ligase family protein [Trueperaceae bacterium]|nr:O-antigen ligase family protein [Trueperaceae bacterium]